MQEYIQVSTSYSITLKRVSPRSCEIKLWQDGRDSLTMHKAHGYPTSIFGRLTTVLFRENVKIL